MEVSLPRKLKFLEAFPEGPIISSAYSLITAGLVSNGPFEFICRPSFCSCLHSIFRLPFAPLFFFPRNIGIDIFFPPIDSGESFEIFPSECFVIESILLSHSDYRARSKKGIPRSVQLSVSRRCIDDHQPAQSRSKILSQQRDLEVKYSHLSREYLFSRYNRVRFPRKVITLSIFTSSRFYPNV